MIGEQQGACYWHTINSLFILEQGNLVKTRDHHVERGCSDQQEPKATSPLVIKASAKASPCTTIRALANARVYSNRGLRWNRCKDTSMVWFLELKHCCSVKGSSPVTLSIAAGGRQRWRLCPTQREESGVLLVMRLLSLWSNFQS